MAKKTLSYKESTSYLGIRIENDLKDAIEAAAAVEDRSVSNWVTRALSKEIAKLNSKSD